MWEAFFGFKKTPFPDNPDAKQLFASQAWNQVKTRLDFLAAHHGVGLLTGEVGSGKSTAARTFTAALPLHQYKILYVHFSSGSALDLLRQVALELNLTPAHYRGDLVRQIAEAVERNVLVVCEVKSRTSTRYGSPLEAVSRAKRARLRRLCINPKSAARIATISTTPALRSPPAATMKIWNAFVSL